MIKITEDEFNRRFLKNFFKELIATKIGNYPLDALDQMSEIISSIFIKEFGHGQRPEFMLIEDSNLEDWLDKRIEEYKA